MNEEVGILDDRSVVFLQRGLHLRDCEGDIDLLELELGACVEVRLARIARLEVSFRLHSTRSVSCSSTMRQKATDCLDRLGETLCQLVSSLSGRERLDSLVIEVLGQQYASSTRISGRTSVRMIVLCRKESDLGREPQCVGVPIK